ncbi:hypothetical protein HPB52_011648 [Rhipicephalus sanguineus]|uniref:Uncharacterized protein n=1 Tax=Rhipicephalus sanguineus TaxID=34632 RepID=A0A9D4SW99_RHISA|nr:hypothetical protein HPB52_011648 [Rhipicephalus sanguineus]
MDAHSVEDMPAEEEVPPKPIQLAHALVPTGADPVEPVHIPPAQDYEDEPVDADDAEPKEHKHDMQAPEHRTSLTFIFGLAVVIITLAAVGTFYVIQPAVNALPVSTTTLDSLNKTSINVTEESLTDD